jgi:MOSC domain-containing protein YiiM
MQEVGNVQALFISSKALSTPVEKEQIRLDHKGILEDKHYGSTPERTVLITSLESYLMTQKKLGVRMPYGYLGENLLIDYNPYKLPLGSRLKIGSTTLEITQNCTLCNHLAQLDKRIPKLLKEDRGIFAKVVESGTIALKDTIKIL